ncbi:MAG: 50S ribosomal protein L11 methyltransferase, partial [Deltaproteobacteria bacterium]
MNEEWIALEISVCDEMADAVSNFCHEQRSSGLVLEQIEPGTTRLTAYFSADQWREVAPRLESYVISLRDVFPDLPEPRVRATRLEHENWAILWRNRFKPVEIGTHLMVTPPWIKPEAHGREVIIIDPGQAFGTGTHETTRGCLILLEQAVARLSAQFKDLSLLDLGCGSGILAIAGRMLGANLVLGVDNDPYAIESAVRNARLNKMADAIRFECQSVEDVAGTWHIVTANLDPLTVTGNRDRVVALSSHSLIISGIPLDQWDGVKQGFMD